MSGTSDDDAEYDPTRTVVVMTAATRQASADASHPVTRQSLASTSAWPFPHRACTGVPEAASSLTPVATHPGKGDKTTGNNGAAPLCHTGEEGGLRLHGLKGRVRCIALHPAGTVLCAGSEEGQLCMWDFDVPPVTRQLQPTRTLTPFVNRIAGLQPIVALHASLDGGYFVACQDGDSPLVVQSGGKQAGYCAMGERGMVDVVQCKGHRAPVTASAAHTARASGFFTAAQDGTARAWDLASFEHGSLYAVKHGSGQINDTVVVESVLGLTTVGSHGQVFASGGADGRVQLWDCRVKYRPGGALATLDVYQSSSPAPSQPTMDALADTDDAFVEHHVGGLVELGGAGPTSVLAVRAGEAIVFFDLRRYKETSRARLPWTVPESLPITLDTSPLTPAFARNDALSFLACTSRAGYRHTVGGHVVEYTVRVTQALNESPVACTASWRAGRPDEDVLCLCADAVNAGGLVYAGTSSGDVVVSGLHGSFSWCHVMQGSGATGALEHHPLLRWIASRPAPDVSGRAVGRKASHAEAFGNASDNTADLF